MSGWAPLAIAAGLYMWQALNYIAVKEWGMALVFFAYALANVGFVCHYVSVLKELG